MNNNPKISFLFPYRWLTEDRAYLGVNLVRQIKKMVGNENLNDLKLIQIYKIEINYQAYKPVDIKLSKTEVQRFLKPVFPYGKCLEVDVFFRQHRSRTILPIIDFGVYF